MHENPSAGKFEPPQPKPPGDNRQRNRWLLIALVIATSYPVTHWLFPQRGRGWVLSSLIVLSLSVLHYFLQRAAAENAADSDPYSPPTSITR
jgi:hypothetical protein